MYYNNGPSPRYRNSYRRRGLGGLYGLPWLIFGMIWFGHASWLWVPVVVVLVGFTIAWLVRRSNAQMGSQRQQYSGNYYTSPVYQPPSPQTSQTPPAETYYQPYRQGYQEQADRQEEPEQEDYAPEEEQRSSAQEYDLPRAEYPQQMPPME